VDSFVPISKEAADKIKNMIFIEKRFAPGSRLPNEAELMKELRISRTSLREAIKLLIANKILYIKRGTGTFVCDFDQAGENIFDAVYSTKSMQLIKNSFELRLILEPSMAAQSIDFACAEDIRNLRQAGDSCRSKIEKNENYTEEDKKFHSTIAHISKNRIFEELMPYFYVSIANIDGFKNLSKSEAALAIEQLNKNAIVYHAKITDCFEKHDSTGVRIAMEEHIYNSLSIFTDLVAVKLWPSDK